MTPLLPGPGFSCLAHANGQLLGTAAFRVHDLEGREALTP
jgi:hypothetical protein